MMMQYFPALSIFFLFTIVALLGYLDRRKKRSLDTLPLLTFIVPCYNDGETVSETITSIYKAYGPSANLIVADDCSTDDSPEILETLRTQYGFTLLRNAHNLGKSQTLNEAAKFAEHKLIIFADADLIVNEKALHDALARLQDPKVGGVSCPYVPQNRGFIPLMQHIEYNMLSFIQGAYNRFSAIALWGGFIVVRREAFEKAGGFTLNAITEDMDLAFKLNKNGWKVEQSFIPVHTYVPDSLSAWFKQKIRWSSGGFQCFLRYPAIWIRNPLHVLFLFSLCLLMTTAVVDLAKDMIMWDDIFNYFNTLNSNLALDDSLRLTGLRYGVDVSFELMMRLAFTVFSLPFVWPLVTAEKRPLLLFLVIPFSILYVPLFSMISIAGAAFYLHKRRALLQASRAW